MKLRVFTAGSTDVLNKMLDEYVNVDTIEVIDFRFSVSTCVAAISTFDIYSVCIAYKDKKVD